MKSLNRRILKYLLLLLLLCGVTVSASSSTLRNQGAAVLRSNINIYFRDFPASFAPEAASQLFPYSRLLRIDNEVPLDGAHPPLIQLMPEFEAYPLLDLQKESGSRSFYPLYRASIVIAVDQSRFAKSLDSYDDLAVLAESGEKLGLLLQPEFLMASLTYASPSREKKAAWKESLAKLAAEGRLNIYSGSEARTPWPLSVMSNQFQAETLPPVLILFDYQAAQLNMRAGADRYTFHVPEEGSLFVDFGLLADGEEAKTFLDTAVQLRGKEEMARDFLAYGYRLADGRSPKVMSEGAEATTLRSLGYPPEEEYEGHLIRIKNYERFNYEIMGFGAEFRRDIRGTLRFLPSSQEEEHIFLIILVPLFLLWIFSIYHRLDDPQIKRPMGILLFWLSAAILLHFIQVMYSNSISRMVVNYIRFLPLFGMVESWSYTGLCLYRARLGLSKQARNLYWLLSIWTYVLAMLFITNEFHGLSFKLNIFRQIQSIGPIGLLSLITLFLLFFIGYRFWLLGQSLWRRKWFVLPALLFLLLIALNVAYFYQGGSIDNGNYDLINSFGAAIILEVCMRIRLIPVNTGYFKLFRNSPIRLRLMNAEMNELYPPERDDIPLRTMKKIKETLLAAEESTSGEDSPFGEDGTPAQQAGAGAKGTLRKNPLEKKIFRHFTLPRLFHSDHAAQQKQSVPVKVSGREHRDLVYNISRITGGYLIWEENLAPVRQLKDRLSAIQEQLEEQREILSQEKTIRSQVLSMHIRSRMLKEIESSLSQKVDEMKEILSEVAERKEDADFVRSKLGLVKIMVSQCKRKSNLLVRGEERISLEEMQLIFREALTDAQTSGIGGFAVCSGEGDLDIQRVLILYDLLQELLQRSVDLKNVHFFVNLKSRPGICSMQLIFSSESVVEQSFFEPDKDLLQRLESLPSKLSMASEGKDVRLHLVLKEEDKS